MPQKLGQHFLKNERVLEHIATLAQDGNPASIVEIGPGHGELTSHLLKIGCPITVIEFDQGFAAKLAAQLNNPSHLTIVSGDVRKELAAVVEGLPRPLCIVGNLPYYLSSFLFRKLSELPETPERCVFLIQKEVAERAAAKAGQTNRLSASLSWWSSAEVAFTVPPSSFSPPPKVDSAVLVLNKRMREGEEGAYFKVVRSLFAQPRKIAANNLSSGLEIPRNEAKKILESVGASTNCRPQELSREQIIGIASQLPS
jgi:16S rRNA (adenine1518-N6/adenine1519-N6)-dimethyltransferase